MTRHKPSVLISSVNDQSGSLLRVKEEEKVGDIYLSPFIRAKLERISYTIPETESNLSILYSSFSTSLF